MTLKNYLAIIWRWWWVWLISLALALTSGYLYSQHQPRTYMARTTLMVGQGIANPNPDPQLIGLARTLAQMYADLAKRLPVTQPVIQKLGLTLRPEDLAERIDTRVLYDAQLLEIVVYDTDPRQAATIANAIAEELIRQSPSIDVEGERFVRQQLSDLQSQIEKADADIKNLRSAILNMTSATEINEAQARIKELEQLKGDNQSTYAQLLLSLNTNRPNTLRVVEPAVIPDQPIGPKTWLNLLIAATVGLALAAGTIVLLEYLDDTVHWDGQVMGKVMGMPVLGMMTRLSSKDGRLIVKLAPQSIAAEMVRQLRTNILLAQPGQHIGTLLVTSPEARDGKTLIAANLAASIASAGMRVALVDCDLRRPSLHELFDLPNIQGLTDLLDPPAAQEHVLLDSVLLATSVPGLMLLPAGRPPLDPMMLLASPRLPALLASLHDQADMVILDSLPVVPMPDAVILATLADATLLVVAAGGTSRRLLQAARNRLAEHQGSRLPGLVFNYTSPSRLGGYGYGYYYYRAGEPGQRRRFGLFRPQPAPANGASNGAGPADSTVAADEDGFMGLDDAAAYLGVSRDTARRWCESGRLPATKEGRHWKIRRIDLQRMAKGE